MKQTNLIGALLSYWKAPTILPQLPLWRQILEMTTLYLLRRIGPGYYVQARWGRAEIPFSDKWQHMNRGEYRKLTSRLNPTAYRKASQHKLIEKSVLTLQNLPTPKFIGFVHTARGRCANGQLLRTPAQLTLLLANHIDQRICFKLVEGWGGFGFASYKIIRTEGNIRLCKKTDEFAISVEEWWEKNANMSSGFLLESHLEQHPAMAELNGSSLNTIRIWVMAEANEWRVLGAYLRVGRKGSQVDNNSSGGIACQVELATGKIREVFDPVYPGNSIITHPDSAVALLGFQIPFWQEAMELAGQAVAAFPQMNLAGLDMAITPTGPFIIELNATADYIGCAWMDLPLKQY